MTTTEIWFEHAGARLYAIEQGPGAGLPVILFHGGLANHLACHLYATALARRFRVITPDLRSSGKSHDPRPLSWDRLADDVAALMAHLGLSGAVIGGVSLGSGCAVRAALRHPALVAGLVVLHPVFAGADAGLTAAQDAAMRAMDAAGSRVVREGIEVLMPVFDALPSPIRERVQAIAREFDPPSVAATTAFLASGAQPFATAADLAAITAPALVVPGIDPYHPREVADVYRAHLPRCLVREGDATTFAASIEALIDGAVAPPPATR